MAPVTPAKLDPSTSPVANAKLHKLFQGLPRPLYTEAHVASNALHDQFYNGALKPWKNFTTDTTNLRTAAESDEVANAEATVDVQDDVAVSSEITVSHRVFENIVHPIAQYLRQVEGIPCIFADRKSMHDSVVKTCCHPNAMNKATGKNAVQPDVVGVNCTFTQPFNPEGPELYGSSTAFGEIKHMDGNSHDVMLHYLYWEESKHSEESSTGIRHILGQPFEAMAIHRQDWGWWTNYSSTFAFKRADGVLYVSKPIRRETTSAPDRASVREALCLHYRQTFQRTSAVDPKLDTKPDMSSIINFNEKPKMYESVLERRALRKSLIEQELLSPKHKRKATKLPLMANPGQSTHSEPKEDRPGKRRGWPGNQ